MQLSAIIFRACPFRISMNILIHVRCSFPHRVLSINKSVNDGNMLKIVQMPLKRTNIEVEVQFDVKHAFHYGRDTRLRVKSRTKYEREVKEVSGKGGWRERGGGVGEGIGSKGDKALVSRSSNSITKLWETPLRRVFSPSFPPFSLFFLSFLISSVKPINRYVIVISRVHRVSLEEFTLRVEDIEKKKQKENTKKKGCNLRISNLTRDI